MKYSKEEIAEKASAFFAMSQQGDARCEMMLMMLSIATGLSIDQCIININQLAQNT